MEVVDAHKNGISTFVGEFDGLLRTTVEISGHQSGKLSYTVIHVYYVVTHLQLVDFFEGDDGFASACVLRTEAHAVVAFEYLVIGVAAYFRTPIDESLV